MAAFNVPTRSRSASRDHNERIRRMEEKMNAIRNSRRSAPAAAQVEPQPLRAPSPKRLRCNVHFSRASRGRPFKRLFITILLSLVALILAVNRK